MPEKIIKKFQKKYGKKKGKSIFYATAAKQGRDPHTFHKEDVDASYWMDKSGGGLGKLDAIQIRTDALDLIASTLNHFDDILSGLSDVALKRARVYKQANGRSWVAFTDGNTTIIVDPSGYSYPRYKTPKIDNTSLLTMYDWQIEKLMGRKENYNPEYVYPTNIGVSKHAEERPLKKAFPKAIGLSGEFSDEGISVEGKKVPAKWDKTVAKHSKEVSGKGTTPAKISKYRKEAEKEAEKRPGVKDPQAYATAVALRRAQKTGSHPHKKLSEGAEDVMVVSQPVEVILDGQRYQLDAGDKIRVLSPEAQTTEAKRPEASQGK